MYLHNRRRTLEDSEAQQPFRFPSSEKDFSPNDWEAFENPAGVFSRTWDALRTVFERDELCQTSAALKTKTPKECSASEILSASTDGLGKKGIVADCHTHLGQFYIYIDITTVAQEQTLVYM